MMNNKIIYFSALTASLLSIGLSSQTYAESMNRQVQGVTYSYDHWPKRWSSAIHQQKDARFPTRQKQQVPSRKMEESVFEHDLFYLPTPRGRYGFDAHYDQQTRRRSQNRYMRELRRLPRESAYAYYPMQPMYRPAGYGHIYGGFGVNTGPIGLDPVMGSPGNGIPVMPGTPYGFPAPGFIGSGYQMPGYWGTPYSRW